MIPIGRREAAAANILASFEGERDQKECTRILRELYIHFGRMLFEVPHILRLDPDRLSQYCVFENEERFQAALDKGKGVFVLTAHFGNWEFMSAAIQIRFGVDSAVIVRPMDFAPLDRLMVRMRSRFGSEVIPKKKAMRRVIGALREKKTLGILLDQNVDWYEGVFVPFLGRWACTNKGLALLALKTDAPSGPGLRGQAGGRTSPHPLRARDPARKDRRQDHGRGREHVSFHQGHRRDHPKIPGAVVLVPQAVEDQKLLSAGLRRKTA